MTKIVPTKNRAYTHAINGDCIEVEAKPSKDTSAATVN